MAFEPRRGESLAPLTTWRIGGKAEFFAAPETRSALEDSIEWARCEGLPLTVLGRGSNVLVPDKGVRGLVVTTRFMTREDVIISGDSLEVSAGYPLPLLAKRVAAAGFTGYEFYIGIPGTVGGAVYMNAGFGPGDERETAQRCVEVYCLSAEGQSGWQAYENLHPSYRCSDLKAIGATVIAARFKLSEAASPQVIRDTTAEHLAMRKQRQPLTKPTAGSVFKASEGGVPAAVYIDRLGLKGEAVGGAVVSLKHANWIENHGGATAADVKRLIELVQERVMEGCGVHLEPEVCFLG